MVDLASPLGPSYRPGLHGTSTGTTGVALEELLPGSIVQVAAWRTTENAVREAIIRVTGLVLPGGPGGGYHSDANSGFGVGPGRFLLVAEAAGLADSLSQQIPASLGSVTDLTHGRTALRVAGPKAEWVLAKLFAIDFSPAAFPVGAGRSTVHHDVFAQIQRSAEDGFDLYVFRSFARSFWTALCHAAEEVGYEVR
jgi:heterotetrameric sarcosine oxidase gamma subunit